MSNRIFADEAPRYWEKGIVAVPVKPGTKKPPFAKWSSYQSNMPSEARKAKWTNKYSSHGVGILLGTEVVPGFQLAAIDVDDDRFVRAVRDFLGTEAPAKRGQKGMTFFTLVPKSDGLKSTTFKGRNGLGNLDVLIGGRFTVIPPTIHPTTNDPYTWIGKELLETELGDLPVVGKARMEHLKAAIQSEHVAALVEGETTHEAGLSMVAQLVSTGAADDDIEALVTGLLPEGYSGNSLEELPGWIKSAIAKGYSEPKSSKSPDDKQSSEALKEVVNSGLNLFNDSLGVSYASFGSFANGSIILPVRSSDMKKRIQLAYFEAKNKALPQTALTEVVDTLDAKARFRSPTVDVNVRLGELDDEVYIDRGTSEQIFVKLANGGWTITDISPIKFRRPAGCEVLPLPERDADPTEMQELLGLDDTNFVLFVAFLLMGLNPRGPYMLLLVQGAQGSGKSYLCAVAKMIIDPSVVTKQRMPGTERDLAIQAKDNRLLSYDNASGLRNDISDALCTLATGGAFVTRKLYQDAEAQIFQHIRPVVINGIGDFAYRPDLLERSIQLNLASIHEHKRMTEGEMDARFKKLLPGFLGYLYDCAAYALEHLGKVDPPRTMRMADAAHFVVAAEPATGFRQGEFLRALEQVQNEIMIDRAANDSLALALTKILERRPNKEFNGRVGELFELLAGAPSENRGTLPRSPSALSNALKRSEPMLKKIGLMIEFGARSNKGSSVRVWLFDSENRSDPEDSSGGAF